MGDRHVIEVERGDAREAALALAAGGELVVLVASGDDLLARAGDLARDVTANGGRPVVFDGVTSDARDRAAIAELLAELDRRE